MAKPNETPIEEPTIEGKPIEAPQEPAPEAQPSEDVGKGVTLETGDDGRLTSTSLADARASLSAEIAAIGGTEAIMVGGGPDETPRQPSTPDEKLEAAALPAESVVGQLGGELKVFASAEEAFDAGASVIDRAAPHLSPVLASEPAILRNNSGA